MQRLAASRKDASVERMRVADRIDIGTAPENLGVDWPLTMNAAGASHAFAGEIDQYKIFRTSDFRKRDPCSLDPEPAAGRVANSEMALGHVGVTLHVQNPIGQRPQSKMA